MVASCGGLVEVVCLCFCFVFDLGLIARFALFADRWSLFWVLYLGVLAGCDFCLHGCLRLLCLRFCCGLLQGLMFCYSYDFVLGYLVCLCTLRF